MEANTNKSIFKSYFAVFLIGFFGGASVHLLPGTDLYNYRKIVEACEKDLPRNQHCKLTAIKFELSREDNK